MTKLTKKRLIKLTLIELKTIGDVGKSQSTVYNLPYWMSYVSKISSDDIFNRQYRIGNIGKAEINCNVNTSTTFNKDLARIEMTWGTSDYEDECSGIMNSRYLGYYLKYNLDSFTVTLDLLSR